LENKHLVIPATLVTFLNELEESMTKLRLLGNDGRAGKVDDIAKDVKAKQQSGWNQ